MTLRSYALRVSITDRCNLRCTYCLPENARFSEGTATAQEIRSLMSLLTRALPIRKIRITGGEPCLSPDLVDQVRHAASLVPLVGLTTNGTHLEKNLPALREAGLRFLNVSLDAPDEEGFRAFSRRAGVLRILSSLRAAKSLGFERIKMNAVATRETDAPGLLRLAMEEGVHLRFIELMRIGEGAIDWVNRFVPSDLLRSRLVEAGFRLVARPEDDEPTSRVYHVEGIDPASTSLGFITTQTAPFCGTCNRLRLTAEGRLLNCLFDERGIDLLGILKSEGEDAAIERVRLRVAEKRPPALDPVQITRMASIGG